jgi:hypothetical protein
MVSHFFSDGLHRNFPMTHPQAGLYRTALPLTVEGQPQPLAAPRLVLIQYVEGHEAPVLVFPKEVKDNRWTFQDRGMLVKEQEEFLKTLVSLPAQGFYKVSQPLQLGNNVTLPVGLLVQLGYTVEGRPVIFPAHLMPGNAIQFSSRGAPLSDLQLDMLEVNAFVLLTPPPEQGGPPSGP